MLCTFATEAIPYVVIGHYEDLSVADLHVFHRLERHEAVAGAGTTNYTSRFEKRRAALFVQTSPKRTHATWDSPLVLSAAFLVVSS